MPETNAARDARWARTLGEVSDYRLDRGRLPGDETPESGRLRQWLGRQRAKEAAGGLSPVQIQALDAVDGDWRINGNSVSWENRLLGAVLEHRETGAVPRESEAGRWLTRQRSRMSAGKLSGEQLEALDEMVPGWRNLDRVRWGEQAQALSGYESAAGRPPTSRSDDPEGRRLYVWLARQRRRLREGTLAPDRRDELDALLPGWRS